MRTSMPDGSSNCRDEKAQALSIYIIGGGIGGLAASIALRKSGHSVEVYEQSRFANESGAGIHSTPNATGVLNYLGIDPGDTGAMPLDESRMSTHQDEILRSIDYAVEAHRWQNTWWMAHRAHLHDRLKQVATSPNGDGQPVKLHTSSRISFVDPESATITLGDGSTRTADVVIGADGVHSVTRKSITAKPPKIKLGEHNCFRFTIPRQKALEDEKTKRFATMGGFMQQWYAADRKIVCYPTARNELLNFVCVHPEQLSHISEDYNQAASKSLLLDVYADFHPDVVALLDKVSPDDVKVYALYDMEALPTFACQRLALLGDAAHPFTPHLAQGGAMAIEDGVSLGIMLDAKVSRDEVPARLQLYNTARYERATAIQSYSRLVGDDGTDNDRKAGRFNVMEFIEYGFSHDELHHSQQLLREYYLSRSGSNQLWRSPISFAALPGPRQDALGRRRNRATPKSRTVGSIRFKTSATLLRNFFPDDKYHFVERDTVVEASWMVETCTGLSWLAGGGYTSLALYMHNVCYSGHDGEVLQGMFCPLMVENLADSVIIGREELGAPTIFSDIDIAREPESFSVEVSWRGATWWKLVFDNLAEISTKPGYVAQAAGERALVHECVPPTLMNQAGSGVHAGQASFMLQAPGITEPGDLHVQSRLSTSAEYARLEVSDLGHTRLPTIHPIAARLAELPIFEMLEASVVEYS